MNKVNPMLTSVLPALLASLSSPAAGVELSTVNPLQSLS